MAKDLKNKIKLGLMKCFKVDEHGMPLDEVLTSPLMLASLLDPRYKNLITRDILSDNKIAKLHQEVIDKITQDLSQDQTETAEQSQKRNPNSGVFFKVIQPKHWELFLPVVNLNIYDESVTITNPLEW